MDPFILTRNAFGICYDGIIDNRYDNDISNLEIIKKKLSAVKINNEQTELSPFSSTQYQLSPQFLAHQAQNQSAQPRQFSAFTLGTKCQVPQSPFFFLPSYELHTCDNQLSDKYQRSLVNISSTTLDNVPQNEETTKRKNFVTNLKYRYDRFLHTLNKLQLSFDEIFRDYIYDEEKHGKEIFLKKQISSTSGISLDNAITLSSFQQMPAQQDSPLFLTNKNTKTSSMMVKINEKRKKLKNKKDHARKMPKIRVTVSCLQHKKQKYPNVKMR
ncbi:unnamed protein product [Didymodactylos carnosus]|uniref:Uncharacterized protein n=1 Tax=Didymodactylos carnosus TaxID=1234261 RepID=A0A814HHB5_9BILA|nr:unnamed protein product [Didymodactylos carnosus]CAF1009466.1 unnamed protein product [Didymodactylos carnosus]CAF3668981.1 unnamed protein product [Didymodactylos carnosus]CAF3780585.1 unnamed protein product [Didymodactylos carnosus]